MSQQDIRSFEASFAILIPGLLYLHSQAVSAQVSKHF